MSAKTIMFDLFRALKGRLMKDPGDAENIQVDRFPAVIPIDSASATTRTVRVPTRAGLQLLIFGRTITGTCTLTFTSGYNGDGDTTFAISAAGQFIKLESIETSTGTYRWRQVANHESANILAADAAVLADLSGLTATAAEINAAADVSANTSVVVAGGGAVTALTGGGTYLIPLVTSNVTITLPAATLGEKHTFRFIGSAADAEDWVISSPTLFVGGPAFFDVGGTNAAVYANGSTHNTLTVNNPAAGTEITFIGDGTNWAVTGLVSSADAPAFTAV
jgi:hypothetical protein